MKKQLPEDSSVVPAELQDELLTLARLANVPITPDIGRPMINLLALGIRPRSVFVILKDMLYRKARHSSTSKSKAPSVSEAKETTK